MLNTIVHLVVYCVNVVHVVVELEGYLSILFFYCCPRNTFVLEYCGEVLDHKEFKTRVKEYARNKNIHYYFMSLKNNEVGHDLTHSMSCVIFPAHFDLMISAEVAGRNT